MGTKSSYPFCRTHQFLLINTVIDHTRGRGHSCCVPLAGSSLDDYMEQDTGLCLTLSVAYSIGNETCLWPFL